jgi:Spy/CpxP family protein refolding chaperone
MKTLHTKHIAAITAMILVIPLPLFASQLIDKQPTGKQVIGQPPASTQPTIIQPASKQPASKPPASKPPASKQPASKQPASKPPASKQPTIIPPTSKDPIGQPPTSKDPIGQPPTSIDKRVQTITKNLTLTSEQATKIRTILEIRDKEKQTSHIANETTLQERKRKFELRESVETEFYDRADEGYTYDMKIAADAHEINFDKEMSVILTDEQHKKYLKGQVKTVQVKTVKNLPKRVSK